MSNMTSLTEPGFSTHTLNKFATIMAAGNGYLGVRACHEEAYSEQTRGMFMAGFYHRASATETTELVNLPDVMQMRIMLDGEIFSLLSGTIIEWSRELHFANGELCRSVTWRAPNDRCYRIETQRFISAAQVSLLCSRIRITPLSDDASIGIETGIDATQTNSGRQHLDETSVRVFSQRYLQGTYRALDGSNEVLISSYCQIPDDACASFAAKNRRLMQHTRATTPRDETFELVKINWISSSLDADYCTQTASEQARVKLAACVASGYDALLAESALAWADYWQRSRVVVQSDNTRDQRALDFALYHLFAMTPAHSERCSIAAKGLTGEGYKGHIFWDTEIFLLPFWLFTQPDTARQLLSYRWHHLPGAQAKAQKEGYEGALFPWESAWTGEEETPEFAAINIRTGLRQKVASALAEHHLVADIAWAVDACYQTTGDDEFMRQRGVALLMETARFWLSRAIDVDGRLEIHDVIGPDEYTEHVNNNAYTNALAHHNVARALHFHQQFQPQDQVFITRARDFLARLYLPTPDADGLLAQDDTFLTKPTLDLSAYKAQAGAQTILLDYARAEVNEMQILKQADVVMLTYLLPWQFSAQQMAANLDYYEPRTIHDSSLSKAIHGIVAARCQRIAQAWAFWQDACLIDLGDAPHSSDDGIHAAATGAIWLGAVQGFAGLGVEQGELHINPRLPDAWQAITLPVCWRGERVEFTLTHTHLIMTAHSAARLSVRIGHQTVTLTHGEKLALTPFLTTETGSGTTQEDQA
nr:glycoside hydrolase family 65 protein [uncultured Enterobacter sp.]